MEYKLIKIFASEGKSRSVAINRINVILFDFLVAINRYFSLNSNYYENRSAAIY